MAKYESLDDVPLAVREKLGRYFSNVGGRTFAITGLPPELTGGALARYSRAPTGMQLTVLNEFLDENGEPSQEKGSALMDRVLNAFGDDSVGELEGTHVGIEDVSQLMTKEIEDRRIGGSPIEQSTRYVVYDKKDKNGKWRYLRPVEVMDSGLGEKYERVNDRAFEVYSKGIPLLQDLFKKQLPEDKFQIEVERDGKRVKVNKDGLNGADEERAFRNAYNFTIRCAALDVGRCVLPSSTLTHLGIYGNGRFYTNLITHLMSGDLVESRERGSELEKELNTVIPTFIKRAKENIKNGVADKRRSIRAAMADVAHAFLKGITPKDDYVTLVPRASFIDEIVSAALFPYTDISLAQIQNEVSKMSDVTKRNILSAYKGKRETRRDRTGRGLEAGYPITFDLVGGFAEYRDLERHRMLTQQRQKLGTSLGFIIPPEVIEVGLEDEVKDAADRMKDLNSDMRHSGLGDASQYATLFNHRLRAMFGMNLREFQHLGELRTGPAGHFSYRAMVQEAARQLVKRDPWTEALLGYVDYSDPGNKIARAQEQSRIAGKNLKSGIDSSSDLA